MLSHRFPSPARTTPFALLAATAVLTGGQLAALPGVAAAASDHPSLGAQQFRAPSRPVRSTPPTTAPSATTTTSTSSTTSATTTTASTTTSTTSTATETSTSTTGPAPLTFGIYPGGPAGGASGSNPDNLTADVAAVKLLTAPGAPFVVHLYAEYYGKQWTAQQEIGQEVADFAQAGAKVELVLCYRPTDMKSSVDVPGFVAWTQQAIKQMGPELADLQVTNEANVSGDSSSNDGSFPGAEQALVQGVIAAKQAANAAGDHIKVGFNWAYATDLGESSFWKQLKTLGGAAFSQDVDWVGVDVYPATWTAAPASMSFSAGVSSVMTQALEQTRTTYMPLAGLGAGVPIHVSESGYPTGPSRSYSQQVTALENEVDAVNAARGLYNVTDFRWFDLRDAITDSSDVWNQYGLMTDAYVPKPAFFVYQQLIAALSLPSASA